MGAVLSLFDYTGSWPEPYRLQGHEVIQLDIKHGTDLAAIDCAWLNDNVLSMVPVVHGILAAPPCTDFALSGAQYWAAKDSSGSTAASVHLVRQVLRCVEYLQPLWWCLENPLGRIDTCVPELRQYRRAAFHPADFGDPYTKRTRLWGSFRWPRALYGDLFGEPVRVVRTCKQGSWVQQLGGRSECTKTLRSVTPAGFARAFCAANPVP